MRFHIVLNREGGTFRTVDVDAYRARAEQVFAAGGGEVSFDVVAGKEVEAALEAAGKRGDIDAMIAGGGDGTISTAARIAWKTGMPLGIIPAGTMNLFARALNIPLDIYAALEILADADIGLVDIASVDGLGFVHQFSVGLHPRMVRFRKRYEFATRLGKIRASVRAMFDVIFDPPTFPADIVIAGSKESSRVSAISVSNNLFGNNPFLVADRVDRGELGIYLAPPMRPAQVARLALDILSGNRQGNPDLEERTAASVDLRFPLLRKGANMVVDGELLPLKPEVHIEIHPSALKVLRPRSATEAPTGR